MFTSLRQRRNWQAGVNARVSTMSNHSDVATIPTIHGAAWMFGYTKPHQRPSDHSH